MLTIRRIAYKAVAEAASGSAKSIYSKIFCENTHATLALLAATIGETADPTSNFTFALAAAVDDSVSVASRITDPGLTFNGTDKAVPGTDLGAGSAIGIWLKLLLDAGEPAANSSVTLNATGSST